MLIYSDDAVSAHSIDVKPVFGTPIPQKITHIVCTSIYYLPSLSTILIYYYFALIIHFTAAILCCPSFQEHLLSRLCDRVVYRAIAASLSLTTTVRVATRRCTLLYLLSVPVMTFTSYLTAPLSDLCPARAFRFSDTPNLASPLSKLKTVDNRSFWTTGLRWHVNSRLRFHRADALACTSDDVNISSKYIAFSWPVCR